jgi:hypothetical protein
MLKPLNFFKKICKFHCVEVWDIDSHNFSSLILIHLRLRIEPNVANLIEKSFPKVEKILKYHLIFMNFGVKNFIVRND